VKFKQYLKHLCRDLSGLLFREATKRAIVVKGANLEMTTTLGIPLGFIVNELITNSAKHAKGNITVRLGTASAGSHSLSRLGRRAKILDGIRFIRGRGLPVSPCPLPVVREQDGECYHAAHDGSLRRVVFGPP
jgi:hypothetical protein